MSHPLLETGELAKINAEYQRDGVVKLPGLLSSDWVERLTSVITTARRELSERAERSPTDATTVAPSDPQCAPSTSEYSSAPGRFTIRWLWRDNESVRRFFTDSGVAPVVAAVIGARRLQYWYDLTFIHDPNAEGEGSPWHHDIAAFPCKGTQIPSLWVALTEVNSQMAPLRCIRGSHLNPLMFRPPVYVSKEAVTPPGYAEMPDVAAKIASGEYEVITWQFEPGDALLIHPFTLHGSPPNSSDRARIAFTTRWAGDDVIWQPDVFSMRVPGVDLSKVERGSRPDGPQFPYV